MKLKLFTLLAFLCAFLGSVAAQGTQVNPATQIRWPAITGAGTPSALLLSCTSVNYGQPFQNTAVSPNTNYSCGTTGWVLVGAGTGNTTSTALTSFTLPMANGANSIVNSNLSQSSDGTKLIFTGSGSASGLVYPEGAAVAGVNGSDVLYSYAASHRWVQNPNNIGALMVPGVATAGTSGHLWGVAANGVDMVDVSPSGLPVSWSSITGGVSPTGQTYSLSAGSAITPGDGTIEATSVNSATAGQVTGNALYLPVTLAKCTNPTSPVYPNTNACDQLTMSYGVQNTNAGRYTNQFSYGESSPVNSGDTAENGSYRNGQHAGGFYSDMGGKELFSENSICNGLGDCIPHTAYDWAHGGAAYGSDQGFQQTFFQGGEGNSMTAAVATGGLGATAITFSGASCSSGLLPLQGVGGNACAPSIGTWIVDASDPNVATTTLSSTTSTEFSCNGTALAWVYYLTTSGGLPHNGSDTYHCAYIIGSPTAVVPPDGTTPATPATIALTAGGTSQSLVNGFACAIGSNFIEPTTISGVSGSSFSADLSRTNTNVMFWQNTTAPADPNICGVFSFNQNAAVTGNIDSYNYVGSPDGTELIYGWPGYGIVGNNKVSGSYFGTVSPAGVGGTITVYPAAWLVRANGTTNSDGSATIASYALRENNARWTAGDTVYDPDYPTQSTRWQSAQMGCLTIGSQCVGNSQQILGAGFSGVLNANYNGDNGNPLTMYYNSSFMSTGIVPPTWGTIGSGGAGGTGGYGNYFYAPVAPASNGFLISNHWPGQTAYTIWGDPWGSLGLNSSGLFSIVGSLSASGSMSTGSQNTTISTPTFISTLNTPGYSADNNGYAFTKNDSTIPTILSLQSAQYGLSDDLCVRDTTTGQVSVTGYTCNRNLDAGGIAVGYASGATIPSGLAVASGANLTLGGLTGYLYGNGSSAVTASTTIPGSAITGAASLRGTVTFTTATTDAATITGVTSSSVCVFAPTNSTASATSTVLAYISSVTANTVTFTHAATVASGATENILCTVN